jgi:CRISPR-associated protein Cmr5
MKTLSQGYASEVFEKAKAFADKYPKGSKERKQYGAMAHKLPVLVRQAGLMQALTFVHTRGKTGHTALLEDLAQTVSKKDANGFLAECSTDELADYMWLTRKTLAALEWFKRFAESVLEVKTGEEGDEENEC